MTAPLEGEVAIVTGAGRGIGEAIATRLAADGARIAAISRSISNAERTAATLNAATPGCATPYAVDVADHAAVRALCETILADLGRVDILVNNAGITRDGLSMRMPIEDWDDVIDTNLKGAFNFIQALERSMIKQRSGRIINISSVIGLMGNAGQANYAASKAGLFGLTRSVARELATRGITANAIAPGFIETDMTNALPESIRTGILGQIPLGRFGAPADVAHAVAFLASDQAAYITGQILTVDGGMVMH
jgi:3-oxoacyl-[acyl-carrier protein] reductase